MIERRQSIGSDDEDEAHIRVLSAGGGHIRVSEGLGNTNPVATHGTTLGPGAPSNVSWGLIEENDVISYDYDLVPLAIINQGKAEIIEQPSSLNLRPREISAERMRRIRAIGRAIRAYRSGRELWDKHYVPAGSAFGSIKPPRQAVIIQTGHSLEWPAPTATQLTGSATTAQRPTGPVVLFERMMDDWGFSDDEAATLLGFDTAADIREVFNGSKLLKSRDANDRLRALLRIGTDLNDAYSDPAVIREWLSEAQLDLDGATPRALLTEGSMENLLRVKYYVAYISGRS